MGAMSSLYSTSRSRASRAMSLEKERGEYPECMMRSTTWSDQNRIWPGNTYIKGFIEGYSAILSLLKG